MAGNVLITQKVGAVCKQALGLLHEQVILPKLLYRDCEVSGSIAQGDTVNVRKPASFVAKKFDRATGIVLQDVVESTVPIKMSDIWDVSVGLTDEQVTLDLTDFGVQVTDGAVVALAEQAEALCVAQLKATTTPVHDIIKATPVASINDAIATLNQNKTGRANRTLVVGTSLAALLRNDDHLLRVEASGSTETLREAFITRLAGCNVYEDPYVAPDEGFIFTRDGAVFVTRAMTTMGSAFASAQTFEGVAIRVVIAHDISKKQVVASFDTLIGGGVLEHKRILPLKIKP